MQQIGTLLPGQSLRPGDSLISPSGQFRLLLQSTDDNLVLYNEAMQAIWSANLAGQNGVQLLMQTNGDLVLYRADGFPVWHSGSQGRPGSRLVLQDDGNLVVYERTTPYWASNTYGGHYHDDSGSWLGDAVKVVGQPFVVVAHGAADAVSTIADAAGQIPLIGPALHGVLVIAGGPFKFTDDVMQGARIDRALVDDLKDKIAGVQEVAPYAQTVIAFVPGIGTGVAAAIGAGLALAQGKPIDQALKAGIRSALPGGAPAMAAFDLVVAAASGDNLAVAAGNAAIGNLGLPAEAQQGLSKALDVVYHAAKGDNIPLTVLNQARSYLPDDPNVQKAFDVGVAVAHGQRLQDAAIEELENLVPAQVARFQDVGGKILQSSPALQQAKTLLGTPLVQTGYQLGMGLMGHSGVTQQAVQAVRTKLPPDEQKGFDVAVAAYQAIVTQKPPPAMSANAPRLAGYVMVKGLANHPSAALRTQVFQTISKDPQARIGATYALQEINAKQGFFSWLWHMIWG